uniref:Acyl-coenzyme A oxidase n=1 Tax=Arcella intermedia TaxID=1963864 RepID=A0A6B2L029_9EUKA
MIEKDSIFNIQRIHDMTTEQAREKCIAQIIHANTIAKTFSSLDQQILFYKILMAFDSSFHMRFGVHQGLFGSTLRAQGTKEQWKKYEELVLNLEIIGSFAMTELGHSSFLRNCETTATFVKEEDAFVINTPSVTGTKWWIGMAGQTATHTVALCQLFIGGENQGLHWFVVPLRDRTTGLPLPGIKIGDVGEKIGRPGLDNGWIQFQNVKIPRTNMLMKYSQLDSNGTFHPAPSPALAYLPLISERIGIIECTATDVSKCITIGVRFSCVRVAGPTNRPIMDFQTHQYQLMPILATTIVLTVVSRQLSQKWETLKLPETMEEMVSSGPIFQDFHGLCSILKGWTGWWAMESMEAIRRCIGGHAYSKYNSVSSISNDFSVLTTGGGDNIVLCQQGAHYLLSNYLISKKGGASSPVCYYFKDFFSKSMDTKKGEWASIDQLLLHFKWLVKRMLEKVEAMKKAGTLDKNLTFYVESTKSFCYHYLLEAFYDEIKTANSEIQGVLYELAAFFGLYWIHSMIGRFMQFGYFSGEQAEQIESEVYRACEKLRQNAVPLVDSFNYPDWFLRAPIGVYDGNIYPPYFNLVSTAPINDSTQAIWRKHLSPLFSRSNL